MPPVICPVNMHQTHGSGHAPLANCWDIRRRACPLSLALYRVYITTVVFIPP